MEMTKAVADVMAERTRQIEAEGWNAEHDDQHGSGSMAFAAAAYAVHSYAGPSMSRALWNWTGWSSDWWKPKNSRHDLVRAAALLIAEIDRIDRAMTPKWKPCGRCTTPDYCTNQLRGCDIEESLDAGIEPIAGSVTSFMEMVESMPSSPTRQMIFDKMDDSKPSHNCRRRALGSLRSKFSRGLITKFEFEALDAYCWIKWPDVWPPHNHNRLDNKPEVLLPGETTLIRTAYDLQAIIDNAPKS